MLSPTSQRPWQRIYTNCAIVAVTIIILFSIYDLRDGKGASILLGDKNRITRIATYNNTRSTSLPPQILEKGQDIVKLPTDSSYPSSKATTSASDLAISSTASLPKVSKTAFITFLGADTNSNHAEGHEMNVDNEDAYFVATRVLGYQLMHQPETRSNTSIPFVVVVSDKVSHSKRARLEKDGAKVVVVDNISDPQWLTTIQQYQGVLTKLRIFQQTEYEKMLYMDADMFITRRMDSIFEDEGTRIQQPTIAKDTVPETAPLPSSFLLAGQPQQVSRVHSYPPDLTASWMCSGFMVFQPSQAIFSYYTSIALRPNSFDPHFPDQNLLNYAHRRDGPMPWTNVYYKWTTTFPTIKEYAMGAATLHEKYWVESNRVEAEGQGMLGEMWLKVKGDMERFYRDYNG